MKSKADLNKWDYNGDTPLDYARKSGYSNVFKDVLTKNGKKAGYSIAD